MKQCLVVWWSSALLVWWEMVACCPCCALDGILFQIVQIEPAASGLLSPVPHLGGWWQLQILL